jgi:hypothetical protein
MVTNRKSRNSSPTTSPRPTIVRRHNENIREFLRQLPKDEKARMVQIESEWTPERTLKLLGQLDESQLKFIEYIAGLRIVHEILEEMGFKKYDQLVSFLSKLDAKLVQAGAHPSEVYFTTQALYDRHSVLTRFDLTLNFGFQVERILPLRKEGALSDLVLRTFYCLCEDAAVMGKLDRDIGSDLSYRVREKSKAVLKVKEYPELPGGDVRQEMATHVVSTLTQILTDEAKAEFPEFEISGELARKFTRTFADPQVFKVIFVRVRQ